MSKAVSSAIGLTNFFCDSLGPEKLLQTYLTHLSTSRICKPSLEHI